jgi:hypothetical protein
MRVTRQFISAFRRAGDRPRSMAANRGLHSFWKDSRDDVPEVARKRHPILKKMNLKSFLSVEHILVSLGGDLEGVVDQALAKTRQTKEACVLACRFFLPAVATVAGQT